MPERTYVSRLEASRYAPDTVFAAFANHQKGDFKPYVLRTTDRGRSWTSMDGDLPAGVVIVALAEDPSDPTSSSWGPNSVPTSPSTAARAGSR